MGKALFIYGILFISLFFISKDTEFMPAFDYDKAWKEVEQLESKQLPESALKIVNEIYAAAKDEKNTGQLIKAVVHQLKFVDYKEENAFIKNLNRLKAEADEATFPAKPILHSMLGEMYWQYYQNNRYRFLNRSETVNFDEGDIETWGLKKIVKETLAQYELSLEESEKSKKEDISDFKVIYNGGNASGLKYRPTLYDFLAHRAINFYSSSEPDLIKPAYAFTINKQEYLGDALSFAELKLETKDELSLKFRALKTYQELTRFHLQDDDPSALVELDLQRLQFIKSYLTLSNTALLHRKALETLEEKVADYPIVTQVMLQIATTYQETGHLYKPLISDDNKWDLKRAIEVCEAAIQRFPGSDGAKACFNLKEELKFKSLQATIEEQNVPGAPFRALIQYKNIDELHYRIIKVDRQQVRKLRERLNKNYDVDREEEFIKYFVSTAPVQYGNFAITDDGDHQTHSVEIKIDALPIGEYMVLFSQDEGFVPSGNGMAYTFTTVTNISYIHRNTTEGETEFYLLERDSGKPIKGASLKVMSGYYDYRKQRYESVNVGNFTTDSEGYAKVGLIKNRDRRSFYVEFRKDNDFNSTESLDNYRYNRGSIYQNPQQDYDKSLQTFFFLDRAIYRPGQTIYFKGLVIDPDKENPTIKPNYKTTIQLFDVNYQPKSKLEVTTNEYGTFSGSFTAPSSGLTGQMQLANADGSGNTYFRVEEYKRPKFYVGFNPVIGEFKLNDEVNVEGYATAYSGAQIDGAKVKYRVVRQVNYPFWWWCTRGHYPSLPAMEIENGESQSDENGKFDITFTALPDDSVNPESDPTFSYTIYADVTDINGETHSSSTYMAAGYKSLKVGVNIGTIDKDTISTASEFSINTTNQSGTFLAAKGDIKIWRLKLPGKAFRKRLWPRADRTIYTQEEYYSYFPNDQYKDENNRYKWEKEQEVFSTAFDTKDEKTFKIDNLKYWGIGLYVLEIKSKDRDDQEVKELAYFEVMSCSAKKISIPVVDYFQEEKTHGEPGETASFYIGTSVSNIRVLYELERDGRLLEKKWISLKNEKEKFKIPIKEDYRGNVVAQYAFVKDNRLYKNQITLQVPYSNKELDITFETFRDKLQPGEDEQWKIIVKGKNKDKIAAEMVATLYDQSLDEFSSNSFYANFYNSYYSQLAWQSTNGFTFESFTPYTKGWNDFEAKTYVSPSYPYFNWFGYNYYQYAGGRDSRLRMRTMSMSAPAEEIIYESADAEEDFAGGEREELEGAAFSIVTETDQNEQPADEQDFSEVKVRTNFNETAFFYPHLQTNEEGEIIIKFTIPEALTTWKMLGFAHTKDLESGFAYNQLITQKELMIVPNQPRFFRENDKMKFSAKISSLVDKELSGAAQLEFFDALTMKSVDNLMKNQNKAQSFTLKPSQSTNLEWDIEIPEGVQAITYRIVAKAEDFSDGEEMTLPVMTNRMLVTESLPLPVRGKQTKSFEFKKMLKSKSKTLRHHRYTLEFTSNPAWYAVQSLPYLMEYPYECAEQTFSRYYANSLATHISNSNPKIKNVFD
ncbi:MAG: alpha-2-macroglobulin family protein, partial [Bacteroidota bacterium]